MQYIIRIKPAKGIKHIRMLVLLLWFFLVTLIISCGGVSEIREKIPGLPDLNVVNFKSLKDRLIKEDPPISTSIFDAVYEDTKMDNFNPTAFSPLAEMPRTKEGGFFLLPGQYKFEAQSYCLRAGTYAPRSDGPGYVYAPLKGSKSEIVCHILERSFSHPEIKQTQIQMLLWAIIAKTKIADMSSKGRQIAEKLLTPTELSALNEGALGVISDEVFQKVIKDLPKPVQQFLETEQRLRQMLTQTTHSTYEEIENVAVLTGVEPSEQLVREIPAGRWSRHPDGYYIRYFPSGYSKTRIELSVPESAFSSSDPHKQMLQFNPSRSVAVPGNSCAQREGCSGRKSSGADSPLEKAREATEMISFAYEVIEVAGMGVLGGDVLHSLEGFKTFTPMQLTNFILEFNFNNWGASIDALGGDPPRSDYDRYIKPTPINVPPVQPGKGLSKARATAFNSLLSTALRVTSLLRACVVTQDRLSSALDANDMFWTSEQAKVLCHYKREAGLAMIATADQFEQFIKICRKEAVKNVWITVQMVRDYQDILRERGFSTEALEAAQLIGLSAAEIEKIKQQHLAAIPWEINGRYYTIAEHLINSLRNGGEAWTLLPEIDPYWER